MPPTLAHAIDYVTNLYHQMKADAESFKQVESLKRREAYINTRLKNLDATFREAQDWHFKLIGAKEEGTLRAKYFESEVFNKIKSLYFDYSGDMNEALQKESGDLAKSMIAAENPCDIKLKPIQLPAFSGGYESWKPFYDLFVSLVHSNKSIPNIQKLHYLKASIHGEAARLLQHVSLEEKNYESAWCILTERYENKRVLVNMQLRILINQKNLTIETASGIKELLDTTTECIHSLRNLDIPVNTWDVILIYIICLKLPSSTQELWEEHLGGARNCAELSVFTKFLETRFRTLESVEQSKPAFKRFLNPVSPSPNFKFSRAFHTGQTPSNTFNNNSSNHTSGQNLSCRICGGNHIIRKCEKFLKMEIKNRFDIIKKISACTNCLAYNHLKAHCPSTKNCLHCNKRHNSLLHFNTTQNNNNNLQTYKPSYNSRTTQHNLLNSSGQNPQLFNSNNENFTNWQTTSYDTNLNQSTIQNQNLPNTVQQTNNIQSYFAQKITNSKVLLATALINCGSSNNDVHTFRALIDPGSEATFVTESVAQTLRLKKEKTFVNITGLGQSNSGVAKHKVSFTLSSMYNSNFNLEVDAFVFTNITRILPSKKIEIHNWDHLKNLNLADPHFNQPGKIDILLGANVYASIIMSGLIRGPPGTPIAQLSELGWIVSGSIFDTAAKTISAHHHIVDLEQQLKRFWEIEEISDNRKFTEEEEKCEVHYASTHKRNPDGRYQVSLPFKDNIRPVFNNSRQAAVTRFLQLEKRFQNNSKLKYMYAENITDYAAMQHMTEITTSENGSWYYLPHHAVFKESTTTKLRVVFDASCKAANGKSLNDCLMIGPKLQNEITSIMMKWRTFKIAYTADITKMYRQIWINPSDVMYQLICWRDNCDAKLKTFSLNTVTFGTASAPYMAIRTLHQLADDESKNFPIASQILKNNFYVDDVMYGADNVDDAIQSQNQLINITNSAGFPLCKWASNNEEILRKVPENQREINLPLTFDKEESIKALGIQWHPAKDTFKFKIKLPNISKISKRSILSDVSRLFDPLGWISPCIVYAKLIMQDLWLQQCGWDEQVSDGLKSKWLKFRDELIILENLEIPRWIHFTKKGFTDENDTVRIQLLTSKTKVAPLKRISLPRLELCGAVLLSKLLLFIKKSMDLQDVPIYAWTDSMITLAWIQAHPSKWKSFVANRVTEIQSRVPAINWNHIGSKDNPADVGSRGLLPSEMVTSSMWWQGPTFLKDFVPKNLKQNVCTETNLEIRKVQSLFLETSNNFNLIEIIIAKHSSLTRLIRVIAYTFRAVHNFQNKKCRNIEPVTPAELENASNRILKSVQNSAFCDEISKLLAKTQIPKQSSILTLNPFLDDDGLLRVGGRLQNSLLKYERRHPLIIPKKSHFTDLLILNAHIATSHGGPILVTEYLQNKYWIISAKNNIKRIIKNCIICFRFAAKEANQLMGNLPAVRVQIARPFFNTGVDYAGPIEIKAWKGRCNKMFKGYIAIFICLCTKAIHIELVSDLSTATFIAAFHRFTARRGICKNIYSDCGTNFVGADNVLTRERKLIQKQWSQQIADKLSSHGTHWHFNPPSAPHMGGIWESGVKSIKFHLKRIVGNSKLTFEEYATLLSQIEACLNSRPLCPKSPDPDDLSVLTPGHFLIMDTLNTPPEKDLKDIKLHNLDRWKYIQSLYQSFWDKWSTEYLSHLQKRPKWNSIHIDIKIGDIVLLKDERMPPTHWQIARVIEIHPGDDKLVRVVTVKTSNGTFKRPIKKLCILPIKDNFNSNTIEK